MKCIAIQLDMSRNTAFDESDFIRLVKSIGRFPEVDRDEDHPTMVQCNFFTEDPIVLWKDLRERVLGDESLGDWVRSVAVVACEGEEGWDDLCLLYHHDPDEKCGAL